MTHSIHLFVAAAAAVADGIAMTPRSANNEGVPSAGLVCRSHL
ncbi:MAG: hypothetical protein N838_29680 [Thiohalocapsa sp. PB-PSB1]|nr:MAG: hypothetical protein N838_29680 [Thiohalocapsa sp. PB-PSB1]